MAELTLKSRILFRKDSSANWSSKNPILKLAEPGWDSTTNRFKIGNGTNAWSDLGWAAPNPNIYKDTSIFQEDDTTFGIYTFASSGSKSASLTFNPTIQSIYPNNTSTILGTSTNPFSTSYITTVMANTVKVDNRIYTPASTLIIEAASTVNGITLSQTGVLPNRNAELNSSTGSWDGISLGSSDKRFRNAYFSHSIELVDGTLYGGGISTTTSLGTSSRYWNYIYGFSTYTSYLNPRVSADGISVGGNFIPSSSSYNLGSSTYKWSYIYGGTGVISTIYPSSNGSGQVGTSSYYYGYGYINYHYVSYLYAKSSTSAIGSSSTSFGSGYINTVYLNNSWATLPSDTSQRALCYKNYYNTSVGDIDAITTPGLYTLQTGITGGPYCSSTGSGGYAATSYFTVLCMATDDSSSYRPMIGIKENDNNLYVKGTTGGSWKRIGWGYGTAAPSGTANIGDIYIQYET
jgi:hypothetical protein